MQRKLIKEHMLASRSIKAYQELYRSIPPNERTFDSLPAINKQSFHINFPEIRDRLPRTCTDEEYALLQIMKTSGSTTGHPSAIPIAAEDIQYLQNYYQLLAKISDGIMPVVYKYLNMFPISTSSTGIFSELVVPPNHRLGRSDTSPEKTVQIIRQSGILTTETKLGIGGLPILHLQLLEYLQINNANDILRYLKLHGICVYGGESPTLVERLQLSRYYGQLMSIYGSTEQSPRLGFSLEPNLIFDIALTIPSIRSKLTKDTRQEVSEAAPMPPISFFFDKYLHNYEIIDGSLVDTPFVQQAELKIRWDQEDMCEIVDPNTVIRVIEQNQMDLLKEIIKIDKEYHTNIKEMFRDLMAGRYNKLAKYYGLILMYGRKGIIFGGANLDNKFVEIVFDELKYYTDSVVHLALYRPEEIIAR